MSTIYRKTIYLALIIALLTAWKQSSAQILAEYFYSDSTNHSVKEVFKSLDLEDGFIISGRTYLGNSLMYFLARYDLNGKTIWSTTGHMPNLLSGNSPVDLPFYLLDDGHLYVMSVGWQSNDPMVFRINAASGELDWAIPTIGSSYSHFHVSDYDDDTFLMCYEDNTNTTVGFFDRATGDSISTRQFPLDSYYSQPHLLVDSKNNLFCSIDDVVWKFNNSNLNDEVWSKQYHDGPFYCGGIEALILDHNDDLFILGQTGTSGDGSPIALRIDPTTGEEIWNTLVFNDGQLFLADHKVFKDKIYSTYDRGEYVSVAVLNKANGTEHWTVHLDLGDQMGVGDQEGEALQVDCEGNVYLTGRNWNIDQNEYLWNYSKLDLSDGSPLYFNNIMDARSVTGNDGGVETILDQEAGNAYYVGSYYKQDTGTVASLIKTDMGTGDLLARVELGGHYLAASRTESIQFYDGFVYVLKQVGPNVEVAEYQQDGTMNWSLDYHGQGYLKAGQMAIYGDKIAFTSYPLMGDSLPPYFLSNTDRVYLNTINRSSPFVSAPDSMMLGTTDGRSFELEFTNDTAYVFYHKNGVMHYRRKSTFSGFSNEHQLAPSGPNQDYPGDLNIVLDQGSEMMVMGNTSVHSINKSTMANTVVFNYPAYRNYHDHLVDGNMLYLFGNDQNDVQTISAFNLANSAMEWEESYGNGTFYKGELDDYGKLYALGLAGDSLVMVKASSTDGSVDLMYTEDAQLYPNVTPFDLTYNPYEEYLSLSAGNINPDGSSDVMIRMIDLQGDTVYTRTQQDPTGHTSLARTSTVLPNSQTWVGGGINAQFQRQKGFIYAIDLDGLVAVTEHTSGAKETVVYPNPASTDIYISGVEGAYSFEILDLAGRLVASGSGSTPRINIKALNKGTYILRVLQPGIPSATSRFVKP